MRLPDTPEMKVLWNKIKPYLKELMDSPEDVPEEIRDASEEYKKLSLEQHKFAMSL